MKIKFENIKKSPLTTAVGAVILLAGIISVFIPGADVTWTGAMVPITMGIALMFMEDGPGTGAGVLTLLLLVACSCSSIKVPANKDRASRKMAKNVRENRAIALAFPDLVDSTDIKVTLPEVSADTVYVDVVDSTSYLRLQELERQIAQGCDPEVLIRWKKVIRTLPSLYRDSTYVYSGEHFRSSVTLQGGRIMNEVKVFPRTITIKGDPVIKEIEKPSPLDWALRVIVGLVVVYFTLRKIRVLP